MPTPSHEWFRPKIEALLSEADQAGYPRDLSVAVITDLVNGPLGVPVPPPTEDNPNQDIGEPAYMATDATGAHPSLADEPGEPVGSPLAHLGRRGGLGGSRL